MTIWNNYLFIIFCSALFWYWGSRNSTSCGTTKPGVRVHLVSWIGHQRYQSRQQR